MLRREIAYYLEMTDPDQLVPAPDYWGSLG